MGLDRRIVTGSFWTLFGQLGFMMISLITNVVLARILSPAEFGQMGVIIFFISLATIFTESGFGGALVRLVNISKADYSTAFAFNLAVSVLCYFLLFVFSNHISIYYNDPKLSSLLNVAGLVLIINAFGINQTVQLSRELNFKKKYLTQLISVVISSIVSISLALNGFGIWSLIVFQLQTALLNTVILMFLGYNQVSLRFHKESFKQMYSFGVNTTLASLLSAGFDNIYQLILARKFSLVTGGLYFQAKKLQGVPFSILNSVIHGVVYSSLSKLQLKEDEFIISYNRILTVFSILMGCTTSFIYLYSHSLIAILYGTKWEGASYFMELLCIASFFYFQELFNNVIFKVFNQTRKILYLEILKKIVQSLSIILGILERDINVLLIGFVISSVVSYLINFYFSRRVLVGMEGWNEIIVISKIALISILSVVTFRIMFSVLNLTPITSLWIIPLFVLTYYYLLKVFKVMNLADELKNFKMIISGSAVITK